MHEDISDFCRSHHVFNVKARRCISVWTNYSGLPTEPLRRPDERSVVLTLLESCSKRSRRSIASLRQGRSKCQGCRFKTSTPGSQAHFHVSRILETSKRNRLPCLCPRINPLAARSHTVPWHFRTGAYSSSRRRHPNAPEYGANWPGIRNPSAVYRWGRRNDSRRRSGRFPRSLSLL